ncbi:MAG: glycine zipper 2TM domain-containing protein, partial [Candidatus Adiutrix sp.]|nr:glycine zipper 2TM domain-containing protein [Candidatus Adiutrix sp.]
MFSRFKSGPAAKISLAVAITLMAAVAAGGCASQYGRQTVKINYYPGCYQPITQLRKDESAKTRNTVLGGIIGGVAGGVIGYQKGGIKGAAIGAAGGALLGAAASYLITNEIQKKSAAERLAAYSEAMNQDLK